MDKTANDSPLKLNYRRTFLIGFAFFGILLLWQCMTPGARPF